MSEHLNISYCASGIASALLRAMKPGGHVTRVDIDCIRCAVIGYLAAGNYQLSKYDIEKLVDASLRKFVEKCP